MPVVRANPETPCTRSHHPHRWTCDDPECCGPEAYDEIGNGDYVWLGKHGLWCCLDGQTWPCEYRREKDEIDAALKRHGYDPKLKPRGVAGGPGAIYVGRVNGEQVWLRNRVCYLDGIEIDGHETSDITYGPECIHCGEAVTDE